MFSPCIDRRQSQTGFAHALICQRVALPSFSVLAHGAACEERTLKELKTIRGTLEGRRRELNALRANADRAEVALEQAVIARNALIRDIDSRRDLNAQLVAELQTAQQKLQVPGEGATSGGLALPQAAQQIGDHRDVRGRLVLRRRGDPVEALGNWIRVVKPGGHLVVSVPDEDLYEQGVWPSTFNTDHKMTFTMCKAKSWSPVSVNVFALLAHYCDKVKPLSAITTDHAFRHKMPRFDQTATPLSECAIEFVLKKL